MGGLREPRGHNGAVGAGDGRGGGGLGWGDWLTRRRDRGGKEKQVGRGLLLALRCVACDESWSDRCECSANDSSLAAADFIDLFFGRGGLRD